MAGWKSIFSCSSSGLCARLIHTLQEDDADLWHDLTLHEDEVVPPPPIPRVVQLTPLPVSPKGSRRRPEDVESLIGVHYLLDDDDEESDRVMSCSSNKHWHDESCLDVGDIMIDDILVVHNEIQPARHMIRQHETASRKVYDNESFDGSSYSSVGKGSVSFLELKPRKLFPRTAPSSKCTTSQGTTTTAAETSVTTISI